jgi:hypothetical protein
MIPRSDGDNYRREALAAEAYTPLRRTIAAELKAATAEHDRLTTHLHELAEAAAELDAESEEPRRLANLRAAIATRIHAAAERDMPALRAARAAAFASCTVGLEDDDWTLRPDVVGDPRGCIPIAFSITAHESSGSRGAAVAGGAGAHGAAIATPGPA